MSYDATEQRKLAAIMFTDMVGYGALSQRDDKLALHSFGRQLTFSIGAGAPATNSRDLIFVKRRSSESAIANHANSGVGFGKRAGPDCEHVLLSVCEKKWAQFGSLRTRRNRLFLVVELSRYLGSLGNNDRRLV